MTPPFSILYEDDFLLAVNKPGRVASVPGLNILEPETVQGKMRRWARDEAKDFLPYLLHRLDRETSGVLLLGKFPRDRQMLEGIFGAEDTRKIYLTLVKGIPHGKSISKPLAARGSGEKIPARTDYRVIKVLKTGGPLVAYVEAEIKTGRKHQIRQHFASIGCPIVLDAVYGDTKFNRKFRMIFRLGRLFLHAARVEFIHPILKKPITIEAPLAPDLKSVLKRLS